MPLTTCFVRHGESAANVERVFANRVERPAALTETGLEQARILARELADPPVTHVYTSPLQRAAQTAGTIAAALGVPVTVADALREYDTGDFEGLPYGGEHAWRWEAHQAVERAWRESDAEARHPGGESLNDIRARFLPFMEALAGSHGDEDRLAIVGHGGLYLAALPLLFDTVKPETVLARGMGHCEMVVATWEGGRWTCLRWGDERQVVPPSP